MILNKIFWVKKLSLLFVFLSAAGLSQVPQSKKRSIDSLEKEIRTAKEDTNKVKTLNQLALQYFSFDPAKATEINNGAMKLATVLNDKKGLSNIYFVFGNIQNVKGSPDSMIYYHEKALELRRQIHWKKGIASSTGNIGQGYLLKGDLQNALKYFLESAKLGEEIKDSSVCAGAYNNLGLVYKGTSDFGKALEYFNKAFVIKKKKLNPNNPLDIKSLANTIMNIGIVYDLTHQDLMAKRYYEDALRKFTEIDFLPGQALCYNNLGAAYYDLKDYESALKSNLKSLEIKESLGDKVGIASSYINIGADYFAMKNVKKSKEFHFKALELINELDLKEEAVIVLEAISKDFEAEGDLKNALLYYKKFEANKDTLLNVEKSEQMTEMETKYDTEKKDKEILHQNAQLREKDLEAKQKETQRNAFIVGFILVIGMTFFILKGYKQKKRSLLELSEKNKIIEEKNKDITDSINYAKRIQGVVLPAPDANSTMFEDSFILYQPKDVISGDFYWYSQKNGRKIITAADCTGHGVPGALMSMIGITFLNEVVNVHGIIRPSEILSELRFKVIESLKQKGEAGENKDGMDMSLLSFNADNSVVEYAGANNPLWICRKKESGFELEQINADKRPVGYFMGKSLPFTNNEIALSKGDSLYIFSDGFADQFGGPKGKKFKYSQLKELIVSIQEKSMAEQKQILENAFNGWKGSQEQVDDVCIIGIRV